MTKLIFDMKELTDKNRVYLKYYFLKLNIRNYDI